MDLDKLKTVPVALSKLAIVDNTGVDKKTVYEKLVAKVNIGFLLKTKYDTDK